MSIQRRKVKIVQLGHLISRRWLAIFFVIFGIFNLLPFLAPVLMKLGLNWAANLIYALYMPVCHQMAQRSFFLFGEQLMYTPDQLPLDLTDGMVADMLALKRFTGSSGLGWKVAWSDRMVYMYGGTWLAAVVYGWVSRRRYIRRLSLWLFVLLVLPMVVDGGTHVISDYSGGLLEGFRYTNQWLAGLTGNRLPETFYSGDAIGSFNSLMRFVSGMGFGFALVWLCFPMIDYEMRRTAAVLEDKLANRRVPAPGGGKV